MTIHELFLLETRYGNNMLTKLLSVKRAKRHFCMELNTSIGSRGVLSPLGSSQISASAVDMYVLLRSINLQPRHIFFYHVYSKV